jgi:Ribbon-helix-helix protein, copG family
MRKKSSIYLEPELDRALTHAAARQKLSKAEFIRRTLSAAVGGETAARPRAIGVFDGPIDLATNAERYLDDGFGEE